MAAVPQQLQLEAVAAQVDAQQAVAREREAVDVDGVDARALEAAAGALVVRERQAGRRVVVGGLGDLEVVALVAAPAGLRAHQQRVAPALAGGRGVEEVAAAARPLDRRGVVEVARPGRVERKLGAAARLRAVHAVGGAGAHDGREGVARVAGDVDAARHPGGGQRRAGRPRRGLGREDVEPEAARHGVDALADADQVAPAAGRAELRLGLPARVADVAGDGGELRARALEDVDDGVEVALRGQADHDVAARRRLHRVPDRSAQLRAGLRLVLLERRLAGRAARRGGQRQRRRGRAVVVGRRGGLGGRRQERDEDEQHERERQSPHAPEPSPIRSAWSPAGARPGRGAPRPRG